MGLGQLRQRAASVCMVLALLLGLVMPAAAQVRTEYEIKAAYLFNFLRFVSWTEEDADAPLQVCVAGTNPFGELLEPLTTRTIRERPVDVVYGISRDQFPGCQVAFIAQSEARRVEQWTRLAQTHQILTISDVPEFIDRGGVVGYLTQGNVIRFEINLVVARESGLNINSRLLELAVEVRR